MTRPAATFPSSWSARILPGPPLIAPARSYIWPRPIPGEEEALARGALFVEVKPSAGGVFLLQCTRGFASTSMPTGVFACPHPDWICAVAGGYAYLADTLAPQTPERIPLRPAVEVLPLPEAGLLVFAGHQSLAAWGLDGLAWETGRVSWEGVRLGGVHGAELIGFGWDLMSDREIEFGVDLRTGAVRGGPFAAAKM